MKLTLRQKRLLLIGAVLVVIAGVYRLSPFLAQLVSTDKAAYAEQRIFTLQKQLGQKKRLEGQRVLLDQQLTRLENGLLRGATPSLSAVTMQNVLYDLANKFGVDVQTVRVLKIGKNDDENLSMYSTVLIQARMEMSTTQLKGILSGLAQSSNLLTIDALNVQVLKKGLTGKIRVTLTIKGLMLANEI